MAEKLMTDGSMALREKQYRVITIEATEKPQNAKLRVAAYARVSSASDDQLNSFAAQNRHYSDLISSKENWRMVDIYPQSRRSQAGRRSSASFAWLPTAGYPLMTRSSSPAMRRSRTTTPTRS